MNLSSLLPDVLGRIEEDMPPDGPVFWNLAGEVYVEMVNALFEAALITGIVELDTYQVTLQPNTTYFALQLSTNGLWAFGNGTGGYIAPQVIPKGLLAPVRLRAPYGIRKTSLATLDAMNPGWQAEAPGKQILSWFPLGISGFGIYPQLETEQNVIMDFLYSPVNVQRPYTGLEDIPLQVEFTDALTKYAAVMLRSKEGGVEAEEAASIFQDYLAVIKDMSMFQSKTDPLSFSEGYGGRSAVNQRTAI